MHAHEAGGGLRSLVQSVDGLIVAPLKAAGDEVAWSDVLERVLPTWSALRVALVHAGVQDLGADALAAAARQAPELPLTLLPEPAHGAAVHAIELLAWLGAQAAAAVRRRAPVDGDALMSIVEDVARIELCWLTLVGDD